MNNEDLEQYRVRMIGAAFKILHDRDLAADVVQEAMLAAIKQRQKEAIRDVRAWLIGTTSNMAKAVLRAMKRTAAKDKLKEPPEPTEALHADLEKLLAVMDAIEPRHKQILTWYYFEKKSMEFIANMYVVSEPRARSIVMGSRNAFREKWSELFGV